MFYSTFTVQQYLDAAMDILHQHCPEFKSVTFKDITLTKATGYWMVIRYDRASDTYSLRVSALFQQITDPVKFEKRMMSSSIHELIHTIPGCWNHGKKFKMIASRINKYAPGYDIAVSTEGEEYGVTPVERPDRYVITCKNCGCTSRYKRKPLYLSCYNAMYQCAKCNRSNFEIKSLV